MKNLIAFLIESKYLYLTDFYYDVHNFSRLEPQKENTNEKKLNEYDTSSELYNEFIGIYFDGYNDLSHAKKDAPQV